MSRGTIHPIHNNFVVPVSSTIFNSLIDYYQSTNRAYTNLVAPFSVTSNNAAFSGFAPSSYVTLATVTFGFSDSVLIDDSSFSGDLSTSDSFLIDDSTFEEVLTFFPLDSVLIDDSGCDPFLLDIFTTSDSVLIDDSGLETFAAFTPSDSVLIDDSGFEETFTVFTSDSMLIDDSGLKVRKSYHQSYSTVTVFAKQHQDSYSSETQVVYYDPAPITSLTDNANLATPIVVIDNVILANNPSGVIPANQPMSGSFVAWSPNFVAGGCGYTNYGATLTLGGQGTFFIESHDTLPAVGASMTAFGLPAVVTYNGEISNQSSGRVNRIEGIFGDGRLLNKQLLLTVQTGTGLSGLVPVQSQPYPSSVNWTTAADAAMGIAAAAGIEVAWMTRDVPLIDAFLESGMTAGDALRSLAARVGGILTWAGGGNKWVIIDPVHGYGGWSGPPCQLVEPGGAQAGSLLDMIGQLFYLPLNPIGDGAIKFVDLAAASQILTPLPSSIQVLRSFRAQLTSDSPSVTIDKPSDMADAKIQIVVKAPNLGPANTVLDAPASPPGSATNRDQWFDWTPTFYTDSFGKQYFTVDNSLFPSGLNDGEFTMNVGYTKDFTGLINANQQLVRELLQKQKLQLAAEQEKLRYFEAKQGSINYEFHGNLPIPGNHGSFTYDGISLTGLVKSVNLSYPDHLAVQIGDFIMLSLANPRSIIDYYLATGGVQYPL